MTTKKAILLLIGILCVGTLYWFFLRPVNITNFPPQSTTIVAFGDSLVYGTGSTKGKDFVSLVSMTIKKPIINFGVPGNTTSQGLERIDTVLKEKPGIVLVLLGGNDALRRVPRETTFKNMREIIQRLQEGGAVVVLLGVRGGLIFDSFNDEYRAIAKEYGAVYISDVLDGLFSKKEFMSDVVHPNDAGYARIAERIAPRLEELLKK